MNENERRLARKNHFLSRKSSRGRSHPRTRLFSRFLNNKFAFSLQPGTVESPFPKALFALKRGCESVENISESIKRKHTDAAPSFRNNNRKTNKSSKNYDHSLVDESRPFVRKCFFSSGVNQRKTLTGRKVSPTRCCRAFRGIGALLSFAKDHFPPRALCLLFAVKGKEVNLIFKSSRK